MSRPKTSGWRSSHSWEGQSCSTISHQLIGWGPLAGGEAICCARSPGLNVCPSIAPSKIHAKKCSTKNVSTLCPDGVDTRFNHHIISIRHIQEWRVCKSSVFLKGKVPQNRRCYRITTSAESDFIFAILQHWIKTWLSRDGHLVQQMRFHLGCPHSMSECQSLSPSSTRDATC